MYSVVVCTFLQITCIFFYFKMATFLKKKKKLQNVLQFNLTKKKDIAYNKLSDYWVELGKKLGTQFITKLSARGAKKKTLNRRFFKSNFKENFLYMCAVFSFWKRIKTNYLVKYVCTYHFWEIWYIFIVKYKSLLTEQPYTLEKLWLLEWQSFNFLSYKGYNWRKIIFWSLVKI